MGRFLVIEDDPSTRLTIENTLLSAGHEVVARPDVGGLESLLAEHDVDALILDIVLPGESGLSALEGLRESKPWGALPVLMISSHGETQDRVHGLRVGADDYLSKPFDLDELVLRAERLVTRKSLISSLSGSLADFTPTDVLQHLAQSHKSGTLDLAGDLCSATVEYHHGQILDARAGRLQGQEALLEVLGWSAGVFQFEDGDRTEDGTTGANAIDLTALLMEAAWLDDELRRRESMVAHSDRLRLTGRGTPIVPETLGHLPIELVRHAVGANTDITLDDLVSFELGAKPKVVLSLTLLIEQGLVKNVGQPRAAGDATQPIIPVIHELVDTLVERFPTATGQTVSFLYQDGAWESLFGVVKSIPVEFLRVDRKALIEHLGERGRGAVRLAVGQHRLLLSLQPITLKVLRRDPTLSNADAIVVWLSGNSSEALLRECFDRVAGGSRMSAGLVVLPEGSDASPPDPPWTLSTSIPQSFSEVCQLLAARL